MAKKSRRIPLENSEPLNTPFAGLESLRDQLEPGSLAVEAPGKVESAELSSPVRKLVVREERKGHGGKTMTRVSGLGLEQLELRATAKRLKRALGCGASTDGEDLLVQGAQRERVLAYFDQTV